MTNNNQSLGEPAAMGAHKAAHSANSAETTEQSESVNNNTNNSINEKFLKPYDSLNTESRIYKLWEDSSYFNPDHTPNTSGKNYCIIMPPPNATGALHIGHAMGLAIQDTLIRYHRMKGDKTLWLPGTDHAAIATQSKVEKIIKKEEGKSRYELGREELLRRIDEFVRNSQNNIFSQTRVMGASCDWSRLAFTLDDTRNLAVRTVFKKMYDDGIIYRGSRIVNWDPKGQTTISDDEIVYVEETAKFYYLQYGPFTIGTVRPETKFGDKYVVMHPDDPRYQEYKHGQKIDLEWINGPITATIIKDTSIDMSFGSGVMTITPAHSVTDFEISQRHHLDSEQIIDKTGRLLPISGEFSGMKIDEARAKIIDKLRQKGLIVKEEDYTHNIATAERTNGIIEPQIMEQWFINVNQEFTLPKSDIDGITDGETVSLKKLMLQVARTGQIKFEPGYSVDVYTHWIENLRDWCISRQIWYGHRIPVWYKGDEIYCDIEAPQGDGWVQDEDTLDTWFSSGLWTFSTLSWPKQTVDLEHFTPSDVMETGRDLIFFWVARMILMTTYCLGEIPFRTVYMHGMVRDAKGRKMSKSLGNGIDPIDVAQKFGADAGRMALMVGAAPGIDLNLSEDKIKGYKHFSNKLWNITRFVLTATQDFTYDKNFTAWTEADKKLIEERNNEIRLLTEELDNLKLHIAADRPYQYTWKIFADQIIEDSKQFFPYQKPEMNDADFANLVATIDPVARASRAQFLLHTLRTILITLHPFMPFVTEEIWQLVPQFHSDRKMLMIEPWPIL